MFHFLLKKECKKDREKRVTVLMISVLKNGDFMYEKQLNYNYAFLFYDVGEKGYRKYLKSVKNIYLISKNQFSEGT